MIRSVKNSALALLVIFVFPILFQPMHFIWHHVHDGDCVDHSHAHCACHFIADDSPSGPEVAPQKDRCLICDFEFSINDLPEHAVVESYIPKLVAVFHEKNSSGFIPAIVVVQSPRAPPYSRG